MYRPKYFELYELVPKDMYEKFTINEKFKLGWYLFDDRLLKTLDSLRLAYGKIVINTWNWGGQSEYRGLRPWDCSVGAKYSQHKFGRAADMIFIDTPTDYVRNFLLNNPPEVYPYIKCIEKDTPHLHIDVRNQEPPITITP